MPDVDRLDELLTEAGERWRGSLAPAPRLESVWREPRSPWSLRATWLIAAGLALVLVGGGSALMGSRPDATEASNVAIAWDAPQLQAAAIHVGDAVVATGFLEA